MWHAVRMSLWVGGSLAALQWGGAALAQTTAPPPTGQDTTTSSQPQLDEVIVTAQKVEEKLKDVPVSVTAISGNTLKKFSLFNFQDFANLTAGVDLDQQNGYNQTATIRGISYNFFSGSLPTTDIYIDEVVTNSPSEAFRALFDVSEIEILRGPTGTLFGRTSPAGAITLTTHRPEMNSFGGYISQSYSDRDFENTQGAVNIPLVDDRLAIRIAGVNEDDHGFLTKDLLTGKEELNHTRGLRESILWRPTDDLQVTVIHLDLTSRSNNYQQLVGPGDGGEPALAPSQRATLSPQPVDYMTREDTTTALIKYDVSDVTQINFVSGAQFDNNPSYVWLDQTNTIPAYTQNYQALKSNVEIFTEELRVQSKPLDFWNYIFGVYFQKSRNATSDLSPLVSPPAIAFLPGPPRPPTIDAFTYIGIPEIKQNFAFFTNQKFQITDQDDIQISARWSQENDFSQARLNVLIPAFNVNLAQAPLISPQYQRTGFHYPTGSASFTHHFDEAVMAYAAWSHGFRVGGVNVGVTAPGAQAQYVIFKPEWSDEYELGSKAFFFGHRLSVNADVYFQVFHDFQGGGTSNSVYFRPGSTGPAITTIPDGTHNGNASTEGVELETEALLTPDWRLQFSASYADSHYNGALFPCNDYRGTGSPNEPPPGAVPKITGAGQTSFCALNSSIGTAPPWELSINTEYDYPEVVFGVMPYARLLSTYKAAYTYYGGPTVGHDPLFLTNIYIGARDPDDRWDIQLWVKNLFDTVVTDYTNSTNITAGNNLYDSGYRAIVQNPPREIGFTARYNF